jgi:hypothetical protein
MPLNAVVVRLEESNGTDRKKSPMVGSVFGTAAETKQIAVSSLPSRVTRHSMHIALAVLLRGALPPFWNHIRSASRF